MPPGVVGFGSPEDMHIPSKALETSDTTLTTQSSILIAASRLSGRTRATSGRIPKWIRLATILPRIVSGAKEADDYKACGSTSRLDILAFRHGTADLVGIGVHHLKKDALGES